VFVLCTFCIWWSSDTKNQKLFWCSFGFVDFASVEDAKKMVKSMNGQEIDGRQIKLDFAEERGAGELLIVLIALCTLPLFGPMSTK